MAQTKLLTKKFKIIVKTNARENKILPFDSEKNAWRVEITEPPEKNKANIAIIKFLSKQFNKKIRITSGFTSKEKICETTE